MIDLNTARTGLCPEGFGRAGVGPLKPAERPYDSAVMPAMMAHPAVVHVPDPWMGRGARAHAHGAVAALDGAGHARAASR